MDTTTYANRTAPNRIKLYNFIINELTYFNLKTIIIPTFAYL